MARIRTVKPEAFTSESLAEVTVAAERTFFGLLTQADDHGRHRDNAAIIAGLLWPLRAEHTSVHVEDDLHQLANAGLICRYTGCDGRLYLHIVTWSEHQKIDKPSQSRLPSCPQHQAADRCAPCKGSCSRRGKGSPTTSRGLAETSARAPRALDLPAAPSSTVSEQADVPSADRQDAADGASSAPGRAGVKSAAQRGVSGGSPNLPRSLPEGSAPGSRILDPGSLVPTGRTAPAAGISAKDLVGEYVAGCDQRPPSDVIGHLGRIIKKLLDEGIAPTYIRAGLANFTANPKHPSVLTSMVNEAMNARPGGLARPGIRPNVPAHQAWTNPANASAAYAEEL
ncbi:hypothetical protein OKJ48_35280 [Streptomyces kunmingensis]|uniref:Phage or prophage related protein n=1 Tax=Streptomyces kunmingensis TaxID=68225 RepID=A0ABU6CL53_9ACTN|nr:MULTISPECIES: hypothetical protein [Streptomyces]MEB3965453.1 hypothetical protein [Streptomyces kunmingensis]WNI21845.1 hypothetical protein RLT58_07825 [Streptomyces sp. ITFR-16]